MSAQNVSIRRSCHQIWTATKKLKRSLKPFKRSSRFRTSKRWELIQINFSLIYSFKKCLKGKGPMICNYVNMNKLNIVLFFFNVLLCFMLAASFAINVFYFKELSGSVQDFGNVATLIEKLVHIKNEYKGELNISNSDLIKHFLKNNFFPF